MKAALSGANVLILGGTGSLGQRLCRRILTEDVGIPASIVIFSRDEAKQHYMRLALARIHEATDDVIYRDAGQRVHFMIGDVRNYPDVKRAVDRADVIFHAAALKQVPTCEYHGGAAVDTNIYGAINLARAVRESPGRARTIVGISTDKACKPVNLMGMTKAIQERILSQANLDCDDARFVNVRYGNVMASRGSAIPMFIELAREGKPIPITDVRMTRFLMTLNQSVDLIFSALQHAERGETFLPLVPSAKIVDIARAITGDGEYPFELTGVRPGEKIHEILVSEEETFRTDIRERNLVIAPILPELRLRTTASGRPLPFTGEFTSGGSPLAYAEVKALLERHRLTLSTTSPGTEVYR